MKIFFLVALLLLTTSTLSNAQTNDSDSQRISIVFGLNQPIITNGFNFEIDYWLEKWIFDYSHGFGLEITGDLMSDTARDQQLAFNISHSVGFGIGYRITSGLNLRLEPKLHVWEMFYNDSFKQTSGKITTYQTWTLGLGLYYKYLPFEKRNDILSGLTIAPSLRWWPNVASSLSNNEIRYFNESTSQEETHVANNIGINNSPFFFNVSVGYTYTF